MSAAPPNVRYCGNCGAAAPIYELNCARCGRALPPVSPNGVEAPAGGGGMPGWVIGVIACVAVTPILVAVLGIVAAIAIPNFVKYQSRSKSFGVSANLRAMWTAEQAWAASHKGEYLDFYIEPGDTADENWKKLGAKVAKISHTYEAYVDSEGVLWISASGNTDTDPFTDEWELSSIDGIPDHFADDLTDYETTPRNESYYVDDDPEYEGTDAYYEGDDDDDGQEGGVIGGVLGGSDVGIGGLGTSGSGAKMLETDKKSQTARGNLEAIWDQQISYKAKHKAFLTFTDGSSSTWSSLGVVLPNAVNHTYAAKSVGGKLVVTASANLDDDEFLDEWRIAGPGEGEGVAVQVKNDALNVDLSGLK